MKSQSNNFEIIIILLYFFYIIIVVVECYFDNSDQQVQQVDMGFKLKKYK